MVVPHTPGPWHHSHVNEVHDRAPSLEANGTLIGNRPNMIARVEYPYSHPAGQAANARLIAAAPELLQALRSLLGTTSLNTDDLDADEQAVIAMAHAVVTKATSIAREGLEPTTSGV